MSAPTYQYEDLSATVDQNGWSAWRFPPLIDGVQHYRTACCDCGLVHKIALFVDTSGLVAIAFKRHNRATGQIRRHLHKSALRAMHPPAHTESLAELTAKFDKEFAKADAKLGLNFRQPLTYPW